MPTSTTDVTEVFYNELRNGRIRVSSILHHWQPHHDMTWRKTIPWLWRHYGDDIRKEINRIIDRKTGKVNVTLRSDRTVDIDEAIRLVANISVGYSAVLVELETV